MPVDYLTKQMKSTGGFSKDLSKPEKILEHA